MSDSDVVAAARQDLLVSRRFGVDFVPCDPAATVGAPAVPAPAVPVQVAAPQRAPAARAPVPAPVDAADKDAALADLRVRHDETCPHCTAATYHTQTVFGEGHANAALMFVGEAPGANEDKTGRPFVGRAGQKLDGMIKAMGLQREHVYIANVLKSRPPENRTPLPDEVAACAPYLTEQIRIIEPKVIVTLGGPAAKLLLDTKVGITRLRGQWAEYDCAGRAIPVMPTFHPAYLLRNYTRETREQVWSDLQTVMARLSQ
jgi:DNA polymerase